MIRVKFAKRTSPKVVKRTKNKARIRKKVDGSTERPRMTVFRSSRQIYAQLIDDSTGKTLVSANSLVDVKAKGKKQEIAKAVGAVLAKRAIEKSIKNVVFDRSGYLFHGRVKAVADGAREAGLNF